MFACVGVALKNAQNADVTLGTCHQRGTAQLLKLYKDARMLNDAQRIAREYCPERLATIAREVASGPHHALVETIAERIAERLRAEWPDRLQRVRVRVAKPRAVPDARTVAIEIDRRYGPAPEPDDRPLS